MVALNNAITNIKSIFAEIKYEILILCLKYSALIMVMCGTISPLVLVQFQQR
nr:MAG TPA: hypothetical protein [Caudoviricetes sp.]